MNKHKYLLKNIGLLTISNFGSKILVLILIPLYTNVLTSEQYGVFDLYSTTIQLATPILTANIVEAVMRFSLDEGSDKKLIYSIGLRKCVVSICVFIFFVLLNKYFCIFEIFNTYYLQFILLYASHLLYNLNSQFSRGVDKVKNVAIAGFINSVATLLFNILFLLVIKNGIEGYFTANILAYAIPSLYLAVSLKIWKYIDIKMDAFISREMLSYSRPMVLNNIAWWINNVSDRYIVTWFCGVSANGIYSVANKIPSILNVFQSIFSQAWTLSAVKEFDNKSKTFFSDIYSLYNCSMTIVCSAIIIFDKLIANLLFANEFYLAWKYAPYLIISVLFGSLSGYLGAIFSAAKKSKIFAKTTLVGASINTLLNLVFVYYFGPIGASISTMISYLLVWVARIIETNKIIKLNIRIKRDCISYLLLILQATLLYLKIKSAFLYTGELLIFAIILVIYKKELSFAFRHFQRILFSRNSQ